MRLRSGPAILRTPALPKGNLSTKSFRRGKPMKRPERSTYTAIDFADWQESGTLEIAALVSVEFHSFK
jgi:hypothetical protein